MAVSARIDAPATVTEGGIVRFSITYENFTSLSTSYSIFPSASTSAPASPGYAESGTDFQDFWANGNIARAQTPAGDYTITFEFSTFEDSLLEGDETIEIFVSSGGVEFENGLSVTTFTVQLLDDDSPTLGNDILYGTWEVNVIDGLAGNDTIYGQGGDDHLIGGLGNDTLIGGLDRDSLDGGVGFDFASYFAAGDGVVARLDAPALNTGEATDDIYFGIEGLIGSAFADTLVANSAANSILGGGGNDVLLGMGGNDSIAGQDGNDTLYGDAGADILNGGSGVDIASYARAAASVTARLDNPGVNTGDAAGDTYHSIEWLIGSNFNDTLVGNSGANKLFGISGNDNLYGVGGDDILAGSFGNDMLDGGTGSDALLGAGGSDQFVFRTGYDIDLISDFENDVDTLALDDNLWGGGKTVAEVLDTYATQGAGFVDLNFGGGDLLRIRQAGITIDALTDDIMII